jgi:hypothetical protein
MAAAVSYMQADPAYRKDPAHAQSHVKHILKSPAHYQAAKKKKFAPTLNMQIGSALHCLVLEGQEEFDRNYVMKPEGLNLATKAGKEWKEENSKKTILSQTDTACSWDAVHGMAASLRTLEWFNPAQKDYRKFNEVSLYWEADELDCKARLDRLILTPSSGSILDLKTTDTIDEREFLRKIIGGLNYLFQSAWYVEGVEAVFKVPTSFIFIGVERTPPYSLAVFEISMDMLAEGMRQTKHAREALALCLKTKQWPGMPASSTVLELPPWYRSPLDSATMADNLPEDDLEAAFSIG